MDKEKVIEKIIEAKTNRYEELSLENIDELPPEIVLLNNLKKLRLSDNKKLTFLPAQIGQLTNLEILYLQHCSLTDLSPEIGQLNNLKELNLRGNQLTKLPPETGRLLNLEKLNLSENRLTSLPSEIGRLISLKSLYLANNHLTCLPASIARLNLTHFDAAGNECLFPPQDLVNSGFSAIENFFLWDADVRENIVGKIEEMKNIRAVEPLLEALKDSYPTTRRSVPSGLSEIGDLRAVEPLIETLKYDVYWHAREEAAKALGKLKDLRAIEPLIEALDDEERATIYGAIKGLEYIGTPAVEPLIAALRDQRPLVRKWAAEALGNIGDHRAVEPLIAALNDDDRSIQEFAAMALSKFQDVSIIKSLFAALKNQQPIIRAGAAEALGNIGDIKAVELLIYALSDGNEIVRKRAAEALGKIGDKKAVIPLITALNDKAPDVRKESCMAQGKIGDVRAVEPLINALGDESSDVKHKAVEALGKIGDVRAIEPLLTTLKNGYIQGEIVDVLEGMGWTPSTQNEKLYWLLAKHQWDELIRMGDVSVAPLISMLKVSDLYWYVKAGVVEALGKIEDPRVVEILITLLKDKSDDVREAVVKALEDIGWTPSTQEEKLYWLLARKQWDELIRMGTVAVEPLIVALNDDSWEFRDVRKTVAEALGKIGDQRAVEVLSTLLNDENQDFREAVVKALEDIGWTPSTQEEKINWLLARKQWDELRRMGISSIEFLIKALKDKLKNVRTRAAKALGEIGDFRAVEPLIAALKDKEQPWYLKARAAEALGKLGDLRAVNPLITILKEYDKDARARAVEALGKIGDPRAVRPLITVLEYDDDKDVQASAAEALGKIGDPRAVQPLISMLSMWNKRWIYQDAMKIAVEALKKFNDPHAIEAVKAVQTDRE